MAEFIHNAWYVGALSHEVAGDALFARRLLDLPILFYRTGAGTPVAMLDRCPHRFAYLSKGRRIGDAMECVYHGLRFGADGQCTRSPYQESPPANAVVRTFPLIERHRMLWIWMGDPPLADPAAIPDHSHMDVAAMRPLIWHVKFAGNWQLGNDNLMELTHLFWLHTGTIGGWKADAGATPGETYSARTDEQGRVQSRTFVPDIERPSVFHNGVPAGVPYDQWNDTEWVAPANMKFTMVARPAGQDGEDASYMVQSHCITPETATTSHYFSGFSRIFDLDGDEADDERFISFFRGIFEREDGPMMADIEAQMGTSDLMALNPVILPRDRGAILVRRLVTRLIAAENNGLQHAA
ncbi:Rieske 2Fe-2S domain-containing protein [Sphingomonas sp. MMS24-J13]|uniref:Rieske 2Fe-2S domain-containing protein n=1 Tax=Sphingomonas sp. MMS24-J13 TaxID=3238686 RepID=UPI00384B5813